MSELHTESCLSAQSTHSLLLWFCPIWFGYWFCFCFWKAGFSGKSVFYSVFHLRLNHESLHALFTLPDAGPISVTSSPRDCAVIHGEFPSGPPRKRQQCLILASCSHEFWSLLKWTISAFCYQLSLYAPQKCPAYNLEVFGGSSLNYFPYV